MVDLLYVIIVIFDFLEVILISCVNDLMNFFFFLKFGFLIEVEEFIMKIILVVMFNGLFELFNDKNVLVID